MSDTIEDRVSHGGALLRADGQRPTSGTSGARSAGHGRGGSVSIAAARQWTVDHNGFILAFYQFAGDSVLDDLRDGSDS
jgi:hypothetical protein